LKTLVAVLVNKSDVTNEQLSSTGCMCSLFKCRCTAMQPALDALIKTSDGLPVVCREAALSEREERERYKLENASCVECVKRCIPVVENKRRVV
jgi:hypothetical protein